MIADNACMVYGDQYSWILLMLFVSQSKVILSEMGEMDLYGHKITKADFLNKILFSCRNPCRQCIVYKCNDDNLYK